MKYTYFFACLLFTTFAYAFDARKLPKGTAKYLRVLFATKNVPKNDGTYGHVALQQAIGILYGTGKYSEEKISKILLECKPSENSVGAWMSNLRPHLAKHEISRALEPNTLGSPMNEDAEMSLLHWSEKDKAPVYNPVILRLSIFRSAPFVHDRGNTCSLHRPQVTSPVIDPSACKWFVTETVLK